MMKKILSGFLVLILLAGSTLYLLDLVEVFTWAELKTTSLQQLKRIPAIEKYLVSQEENQKLKQELETVNSKLEEMKRKNKQLLEELEKTKTTIDQREERINSLQEELSQQESEQQDYNQKVANLTEIYSSMEEEKAANILSGLKAKLTIDILEKMDQENVAEILELMPTEVAVEISTELSR
ncbi:MotE family protein [Halanaerobaculum tunisiense]